MDKNPIKIVVYHCTNLRLFLNGNQRSFVRERPGLSLVAVPCSGKVEAHHLLKTMAGGAQGVLVLACAEKACQYLEGSKRSRKRVDYAKSWLQKLGIEPERLKFIHLPPMDVAALDALLKEFASELESFGTIPPIAKTQTELNTTPR
jgi:F420-non-reducing hydrogenase iron-sulfur subunit